MKDRRLLMLGLDAVSLPFIRDHLVHLPALASLLKDGVVQELQSPAEYFAASVWPTFLSGKQPGEHGQYFPFQWSAMDQSYRRLSDRRWSEDFDCEPFWHRLANAGVPTIAFDIAHALHDERAPCLQITNWSYQSSGDARSSDPAVLKEIRRKFGRRPIGSEVPVPKSERQCKRLTNSLARAARAKGDATVHLMSKPWRLFVVGWYEAHRAGHNLWPVEGDFASDAAPDAMLEIYREMDRQLGRVVAELRRHDEDASILVFSLHGMEPNRAQDHFLNEILVRLNAAYLGQSRKRSDKPRALNPVALLRRVAPASVQYWAAGLLGETVQDWVVKRSMTAGRDWQATPSFPLVSGGEGFIRLNIKGRENVGFFDSDSDELNAYVSWLRERLGEIMVCETGERLVRRTSLMDEKFGGPGRPSLPDIVVEWAPDEPATRISSPEIGVIDVSLATGRGGNHNASAFLIANGDDALLKAAARASDVQHLGSIAQEYLAAV